MKYLKGINFSLELNFNNFTSFGWFGKNWFLLKSLVNCQFVKFGKLKSSKKFKFWNRANHVSGWSSKRLFLISYEKLLEQIKYFLAKFSKFNSRKLCKVGFFAKIISRKNKKSSLKILSRKIVIVKINSLMVDTADFK